MGTLSIRIDSDSDYLYLISQEGSLMFPLTSTKTVNTTNLVSSAETRAILIEQMQIHDLCQGKPSLREFLAFQGWLPPNNTEFLSEQWLIGLKKNKQERIRLEWRNSLAVARLKSIVKR